MTEQAIISKTPKMSDGLSALLHRRRWPHQPLSPVAVVHATRRDCKRRQGKGGVPPILTRLLSVRLAAVELHAHRNSYDDLPEMRNHYDALITNNKSAELALENELRVWDEAQALITDEDDSSLPLTSIAAE